IDFVHRSGDLAKKPSQLEQQAYIRRPLLALAETYLACLATALLLSAIVLARAALRRRLAGLAGLVLLSYWFILAACFESAALNSLEVYRYMTVQLIFTILAQFLTILLSLEFLIAMWGSSPEHRPTAN